MKIFSLLVGVLLAWPTHAALNVFATVPEWAALAREIGGERVNVFAATHALQDPHRIEAKPSLIARARAADLVIATGAELEIGWLPVVLREAGNPRIVPGNRGYFEAAQQVRLLEVPIRLDRADGDVHPDGNPHIQTDPRNILRIGEALTQRLAELDPAQASAYREGWARFSATWRGRIAAWEQEAAALRGQTVISQHKGWAYLYAWLGLRELGTLEPVPGVEPGAQHLAALRAKAASERPVMIVRAAYDRPRSAEWLAGETRLPLVVLPFTVGGNAQAWDLIGLFDDTVRRLVAARPGA